MWGGVLSWGQPSCTDSTPYFFTSIVFFTTLSTCATSPAVEGRGARGFWEENRLHFWDQEKSGAADGAQGSAAGVQEWPKILVLSQLWGKGSLLPQSAGTAMSLH